MPTACQKITPARRRIALRASIAFVCLLLAGGVAAAQDVQASLRVLALTPPRISVEGRRDKATTKWSFRTTYAGLLGLGARIEQLTLGDAQGAPVAVRQLAPGEYEAAQAAVSFRYEVKLDPPVADADAAHVSWLTPERGILMPGDLLPLPAARAQLRLALPAGWQSAALEGPGAGGTYELAQAGASVILVGRGVRQRAGRAGALTFTLASDGDWAFADEDAAHIMQEILQEYVRATGAVPRKNVLVVIAPFPRAVPAHVWSAETRGGTVLMLTGRAPSKNSALAQLSMPLAHELFHLWVPNGLTLAGDYDWFFEGFTLYESVRAGVRLGYLSFQNYLDNLALAFNRTNSARASAGLSLLEASRRRWSDPTAAVYHRGMLAAYLYDLSVRQQTGGKRSIDDVYRALFHQGRTSGAERAGNEVVLEAMNAVAGGPALTELYIKGSSDFDLARTLAPFGLQVAAIGASTRISVAPQLNRAQRDLLKQIGYNEAASRGHSK
ncbi:MAG TPA: hypothetical protein VF525_13900 [Pyrinomonadaceae bacterium]